MGRVACDFLSSLSEMETKCLFSSMINFVDTTTHEFPLYCFYQWNERKKGDSGNIYERVLVLLFLLRPAPLMLCKPRSGGPEESGYAIQGPCDGRLWNTSDCAS